MYVRWQHRFRRQPDRDVRWTAILVETVRRAGKPRQRHIACLASITQRQINVAYQHRYFWNVVYERLDHLNNRVSIDDRKRIEAAIAHKISRLFKPATGQQHQNGP